MTRNYIDLTDSIKKYIKNQSIVFVFPTEVAAKGWADWTIKNNQITGVKAIAMDRFIAWDDFKGSCIKSQLPDRDSIPSIMRKVFASYLLDKNETEKRETGKTILKNLITEKFAENASAFSDWIAKILPSLQMWKNYHDLPEYKEKALNSGVPANDSEDADYEKLYEEYKAFLDDESDGKKKLFDPAWEKPPFQASENNTYIIVYPQILEDWAQYETLLKDSPNIIIIDVPKLDDTGKKYKSVHFENSILELRDVALFMIEKHEKDAIAWTDMEISIADMDSYASYIDRELSLYEIPHILRYSQPLSSSGAGSLFSQIQECVSDDFSFESIKNLLLNNEIPWKNQKTIDSLIKFGKDNNCICSYEDNTDAKYPHKDPWIQAFYDPVRSRKTFKHVAIEENKEIKSFYEKLKSRLEKMVKASTFKEIDKEYKIFRAEFINMEGFEEMQKSDRIISRCIAELLTLIDVEENYPNYKIRKPYSFFVNHLSKTKYLAQNEKNGVEIYPYRTAAAAPFKVHIVIGATQDDLAVGAMFKQLNFLNENKRKVIMELNPDKKANISKFIELDPTEDFITLYTLGTEASYFTSSTHSYKGYGFAHGSLETENKIPNKNSPEQTLRYDNYTAEKMSLCEKTIKDLKPYNFGDIKEITFPKKLYKTSVKGFSAWKKQQMQKNDMQEFSSVYTKEEIKTAIDKALKTKKSNQYTISQSILKSFFECPRKWLLSKILKLNPLNNEAELMNQFIAGTLNHAIFEEFFDMLKEKNLVLTAKDNYTLFDNDGKGNNYKAILKESVDKAWTRFIHDKDTDKKNELYEKTLSHMTKTIIDIQKEQLVTELEESIANLCKEYEGYFVFETEKNYTSEEGNGNYILNGKIDCILYDANGENYTIIDYKTNSIPKNIFLEENDTNTIPDFQAPVYIKLFEKNNPTKELTACKFYSIKNKELYSAFDILTLEDEYQNKNIKELINEFAKVKEEKANAKASEAKNINKKFQNLKKFIDFERAKQKSYELINIFCKKIDNLDFSIDENIQTTKICTNKNKYGASCRDWQAICRRFFTVSGEGDEIEAELKEENKENK